MVWSIVSKAADMSKRHKQETCWLPVVMTILLYSEMRSVLVMGYSVLQ